MLHLVSASSVGPLADALANVIAEPLDDPMTPEWVAVPTIGMRRWLALELARSLGASAPGAGDGVAANIRFATPGALRQAVLGIGRTEGSPDPWHVDSLAWAILDVLRTRTADKHLGPLTALPDGATWFGRARRLADLFDRYSVRRPELLLNWHEKRDVDGTGHALAAHDRWQPHLWRLVRARIGEPSPPERLPSLLDGLRGGTLEVDLPSRLALFGLTTLPSGAPFIELLDAVATRREVHLLLLDPSPAATARVRQETVAAGRPVGLLRSEDPSDAEVRHPLLRSWGRPYRERTVLLAAAEAGGVPAPTPADPADAPDELGGTSLLRRIQADLRADRVLAGDFELGPGDRSIQVHACHGQVRQVEVLRDAILHLLADDPTLTEDDIVVLCPAIDQFAPLIEAGFGTSVDQGVPGRPGATPRLRYRVTDRSLRESNPALAALEALLGLVAGRCSASEMLDFVAQPPVRERFGFTDDDDLRTIEDWVANTNVRWGLDGRHRSAWGLPAEFTANTWRAAIDRLCMGIAVSDEGLDLAPGEIAPLGVEGSEIAVAGRLADLVARLEVIAADVRRPRTATAWCDTLSDAISQLFAVDADHAWQLAQVRRVVAEVRDEAVVAGEPAGVELALADLRRLLSDRLHGAPRRADFFRGGVTVSSLTPLRWLPFRVVCLLGLDEAGTSGGHGDTDGDDLAAVAPLVGDRDARAEVRQALLEAVLAAGDHLVVTRTGHSIRTNQEVPASTALAELRDAITATVTSSTGSAYRDQIETVQPRQAFDVRCFLAGALGRAGPWSFDAEALAGARALADRAPQPAPFVEGPLPPPATVTDVITLADLQEFFNHPAKAFVRHRLRLHLPGDDTEPADNLATSLDGLETWDVANKLVGERLAGHSDEAWKRYERAVGRLPAGGLGDDIVDETVGTVDALLALAEDLGVDPTLDDALEVDVELADGTRVVGSVAGRCRAPSPGPARIVVSKPAPKQHLAAWLDLMALVATDPEPDWRSVVVRRSNSTKEKVDALQLRPAGATPDERRASAREALEVALDCYRRGLSEPVPLFAKLSRKLYDDAAGPGDWTGDHGFPDGNDGANRLAFGDIDFDELCAVAARPDDPRGDAPGRAQRYAAYLWGAVEDSSEPTS